MTRTWRDLQPLAFEHVIRGGMLARYLLYILARYIYEPYEPYEPYDYYDDYYYDDKYDPKTQHMTTTDAGALVPARLAIMSGNEVGIPISPYGADGLTPAEFSLLAYFILCRVLESISKRK